MKNNRRIFLSIISLILISAYASVSAATSCKDLLTERLLRPSSFRSLNDIKELVFMTFNVENLFVHVGKFDRLSPTQFVAHSNKPEQKERPKPHYKIEWITKIIDEENPDIITVQEVESKEALENLAMRLNRPYKTLLIEGNDGRGIDIGFLVKTDLPLDIRHITHKEDKWFDPVTKAVIPLYSRDLPILEFRVDKNMIQPSFILIGNHAKSKRDRPGDPESKMWRAAQYEGASKIIKSYLDRGTKVIFAGDFNIDVRKDSELNPVRNLLASAFDVAVKTVLEEQRITHTYHPQGGATHKAQMDDVMVSNNLNDSVVSAQVVPYKSGNGTLFPIPETYEQRQLQPSDHRPVIVKMLTRVLFGR